MGKNNKKTIRFRYYIDKNFQNRFIFGFSSVILLVAFISLAILWVVRENPYNLLPNHASILVDVDASRGIIVSEKKLKKKKKSKQKKVAYVQDFAKGTSYFPVKTKKGKLFKYNAFDIYWYPIVLLSGLNIILVILFGLFFSHRMAGPVHRIKQFLREYIATGQAKYISLRKRDHLKELAVLLNQAFKLEKPIRNEKSEKKEST